MMHPDSPETEQERDPAAGGGERRPSHAAEAARRIPGWDELASPERATAILALPRRDADDVFLGLSSRDQAEILRELPREDRRSWLRLLAPDDAADVIQEIDPEEHRAMLDLLDAPTRREVEGLLRYAEDQAGGLMNSRYARLRPAMTVAEAISYLRRYAREHRDAIYYAFVLDSDGRLLGVVSFRDLFAAEPGQTVTDIMRRELVTLSEHEDQEVVSRMFATHRFLALPVVDGEGRMQGIVTIDDIVDVVQEEATEDIQKIGGTEALDAPYLSIGFFSMTRKRAGWLSALFVGEMLTATAMGYFEAEIARAVVLALFVPLIISSGGNSGSQATTLVIRAMALGEVRLRDWWRVIRRELASGVALGSILATIGLARILIWQALFHVYGDHAVLIAATVALSLVGVVTFGTLAGSMLPFVLRRLGLDPASASAPFVATLVDVTGLVIYFSVAALILHGTLL
ncbi:MAG TPA: magnesium transporter [Candidatus Binatia bacterium]|nr:magnesium transporter [Candidatus Binatia bacterium]